MVSQHPAKKINKIYLTNKDHNESTCQQATLQCIEMAYWETERKPDREIESIINYRFHHCTITQFKVCFFDVKYRCIIHCLSNKKWKGRYIECNCSVFENGCMYMTSVWMYIHTCTCVNF